MNFQLSHLDTCLPDYFLGSNLPHIQIPVYSGMTLDDIKIALREEIACGQIGGSTPWEVKESELFTVMSLLAIDDLTGNSDTYFDDIESNDDHVSVYAYFVFIPEWRKSA